MAEAGRDDEGCAHYRRRCAVQAPCCGAFFVCHLCHDDHQAAQAGGGGCQVEMKGSVEGGTPPRYLVERVRCLVCSLEQNVQAGCEGCGVSFGDYYCAKCRLFTSPSKAGIFHCEHCGICRVGKGLGVSHFHCDTCHACYTLESKASHKCVERALESDCPVCMQFLFTSPEPLFVGPHCGHALHSGCVKALFKSGTTKCPTCGKPMHPPLPLPLPPAALVNRAAGWAVLALGAVAVLLGVRYLSGGAK